MKLIEEEEAEKLAPPDEPPALEAPDADVADSEEESESGVTVPPLVRWVILAVVAIIIIFLIVLLIRWIYHEVHHTSQPVTGTSQTAGQSTGLGAKNGAGTASDQTGPAGGGAGTNTANGAGNTSLPNNGPGNVAAVFAISAGAAAGLHYLVRSRRFSDSD